MRIPYKRIPLPYEKKILDQLSRVHPQTEECQKYSSEWISKSLDAAGLQEKFGENWDSQAIDIKDYYRAQGFREAVRAVVNMKLQKQKDLRCSKHEMPSQEIPAEWEELIQKVVHHYLNGLLPYEQSKFP